MSESIFASVCARVETLDKTTSSWPSDLVEEVKSRIFSVDKGSISVFAAQSEDPTDLGHAMGVIAATIGSDSFAKSSGRKKGRNCGTFLLPHHEMEQQFDIEKTPDGCTNFWPAREYHFDIHVGPNFKSTPDQLAMYFLQGLQNKTIKSVTIRKKSGAYPFDAQAQIVLDHCRKQYPDLDPNNPPQEWQQNTGLSPSEQITRLLDLSG